MPLPPMPTQGEPWEPWGRAAHEIITSLETALSSVTGFPGMVVSVVPNARGTFDFAKRPAGARLMWLRSLSTGTLAPLPDESVGYLPGDLVFPTLSGEVLPGVTTTLFSDSFTSSEAVLVDGRFGDAFAGGAEPTWRSDRTQGGTDSRARVTPGLGLDLYDRTFAYVVTPELPTSGNIKANFVISELVNGHGFGVVVRGSAYNGTDMTSLKFKNDAGALAVSISDSTTGTAKDTVLGRMTNFTSGAKILLTIENGVLKVTAGSTVMTSYTLNSASKLLKYFTFRADWSAYFCVRDLIVERV